MRKLILSFATLLCFAATATVAAADKGFTITGTVATGLAGSGAGITVVGADGTALSQTATAAANGTYTLIFTSSPTFPIQINATVKGTTLSNLATSTSSVNRNLNQVTSAATTSAISSSGSLASVTETGLSTAGQSILSSALGGGVSYETFSTASFTARTSATDFTQTASVADVFLDTLGERAASSGSNLRTLLTTQTTPLLETDSFAVDLSTNLALVNTTDSVTSVITGGTKAQAVNNIATTIRSVVTSLGTKDKAAVGAARAVGAAITGSIASSSGLTSSAQLSNLANNVTLLVKDSVTTFVKSTSASTLSTSDLTTLATTLGTSQGTALKTLDLTTTAFTPGQVSAQLATVTTSLSRIGTVVQGTANKVASGTPLNQAVSQDAGALNTQVSQTTAVVNTASTIVNTLNTINSTPINVEPVVNQQPPASPS